MKNILRVKNKGLNLPVFMPDATHGVLSSLTPSDLEEVGVEAMVTNTFHLSIKPGSTILENAGGLKKFMKWKGLLLSDSGGFQALSLIHKQNSSGSIDANGIRYKSVETGKDILLTPEKTIRVQFRIGSDILICLDDCPAKDASEKDIEISVDRTIKWAERSKSEYEKIVNEKELTAGEKPLLFAVIQGGDSLDIRKRCAEALIELGFDGYGFGGWPLDGEGNLNSRALKYTAELIPDDKYKYAMGVGNPNAVVKCFNMGYRMFDCVLPSRDARTGRLYILNPNVDYLPIDEIESKYNYLHIVDSQYKKDFRPVDSNCDCKTCRNYSRAYLYHLFDIGDSLAERLSTIHNLRTYTRLIEILRKVRDGSTKNR